MADIYFLVQQTMFFAIPLLIVAIGGMFSERSGVVNIALEGIMIIGAFFGIGFIHFFQGSIANQQLVLIMAVVVSAIAGMLFSVIHAFAAIHLKANQTISGTALNIFAPAFCIFVARTIQRTQQVEFNNTFRIRSAPFLGSIPVIGDLFFKNTYLTTYLGLIILLISAIVLYKTRFGLRLRACGELPQAVDSAGVSVYKIRYSGVLISGLLAGIGGLVFVVPTSTNFDATVSGYGFLALAVLIFGQWKPFRILMAAFFFGFMKTISATYSGIPFLMSLGIPAYYYKITPYIATLVILAFVSKNAMAPRAAGEPYDKGKR